tara:strand:+ start:54 stop:533 length:480 start_codon:yes stop_codon:yes gene_type:complete
MKNKKKSSFFEKLTGSMSYNNDEEILREDSKAVKTPVIEDGSDWIEEEAEEGQLTVDVFQNPDEIIVKAMVAGVKGDDLSVSITRDMVTIKGRREEDKSIMSEDYFYKELYWGGFSRTILLPEEVDPDQSEAVERQGLLTIRMPKIDKERTQKLKVKSG